MNFVNNDELNYMRNFFKEDEDEDAAPSPVHQHHVFKTILNDIFDDRTKVTKENLDNTNNNFGLILVPAICAVDTETGYISMEKSSGAQKSCPTEIKLTVSPWYAKDLAVSQNITYTVSTEDLEPTEMCSQYNGTVSRLASINFVAFAESYLLIFW